MNVEISFNTLLYTSLYTSPLGDIITGHGLDFHFYADDSQLYLAFESTTEGKLGALVQIEMCVKEIDLWMVKNKLKLNGDKTELLVINARNRLCPAVEYIEVSNSRIQPSTSARNIGVTFDQHMSMDKHVTNICKNCSWPISGLYQQPLILTECENLFSPQHNSLY
jgi:hypothetical protein